MQVVGVVVAMRQLGKLAFIVVRDCFSEIQAFVTGQALEVLKNEECPFYATISGVLRPRPAADARPDSINGLVEIEASTLHIHQLTRFRPLDAWLNGTLSIVTLLQSRGFVDVNTLARVAALSYPDSISGEDSAHRAASVLGTQGYDVDVAPELGS